MQLYFSHTELCIDPDAGLPLDVADRMLKYHIWEMNPIRQALDAPIWASQNSGFRHKDWERQRNRAPDNPFNSRSEWSRHTFEPTESSKDPDGKGAVDWTTRRQLILNLAELLLMTNYSRICYYPDTDDDDIDDRFFHCDYGFEDRGRRLFVNESGWVQKSEREWLKSISNGR